MKFIFLLLIMGLTVGQSNAEEFDLAENKNIKYSTACDQRNSLATLSFVGDVLIHKAFYQIVASETQHFSQLWQRVEPLIQKANYSVGNLEGPAALGINKRGQDKGDIGFVYDGDVYSGTNFVFNYHPRILQDLKKSGFDLLTLANNHALDRKSIGIDKTILAARALNLPTVGTRHSEDRNGMYYHVQAVNNMQIAFVGCTEMTNGSKDTKDQVLFCYRNETVELIKQISARSDIDAVFVYPHWGSEYTHVPDWHQQTYAKKYLDAGAIAVIGSHPHVLQPWQKYVTKDGRETIIVYSLGNFIAGQKGLARKTSVVSYVGLSKQGHEKAKIVGVGYTPIYRNGKELFPMGRSGQTDVIKHTTSLFGEKGFIEPTASLLQFLCSK